jgi:hypothetical protein
MNELILKVFKFLQRIKDDSVGVDIIECKLKKIEKLFAGKNEAYEIDFSQTSASIKGKANYEIDSHFKELYYLSATSLKGNRRAQIPGEGLIYGGFYINGYTDLFLLDPTPFWESFESKFNSIGFENLIDHPDKSLRWLEVSRAFNDPEKLHHYGCIEMASELILKKYYFYDCGFIYNLPFNSFNDYLCAMISTAAVRCWQLFYVNQETIISKNKKVPYILHSLHTSSKLDEKLRLLNYDKDLKYDRLDIINEYIKRAVDLLPKSFPFLDFTHHVKYYEKFEKLYEDSFK